MSLEKTLICVDDLERRGCDLSIKDVIGLLSILKEKRGCKIVIILNENERGLEDYIRYREKVVDIELKYNPSKKECSEIAFEKNDFESEELREFSQTLGIKNIRVLRKSEKLVRSAMPFVEGLDRKVKSQVIHSIILFVWSHSCSKTDSSVPSIDFILERLNKPEEKDLPEEHKKKERNWRDLLNRYGYAVTDELDLVLATGVQEGYFLEPSFVKAAEARHEGELASRAEGSLVQSWSLYHNSFDHNHEDLVSALHSSFRDVPQHISLLNLSGTVNLLRDLKENETASDIIDMFIKSRVNTPMAFNLNDTIHNPFSSDVSDDEIKRKFEAKFLELKVDQDPKAVIKKIHKNNGWNSEDVSILSSVSADEYYEIFRSMKGQDMSSAIQSCLSLGRFLIEGDNPKSELLENCVKALKKIAGESTLNKRRVEQMFGISI